jgi:hypothetical protein
MDELAEHACQGLPGGLRWYEEVANALNDVIGSPAAVTAGTGNQGQLFSRRNSTEG